MIYTGIVKENLEENLEEFRGTMDIDIDKFSIFLHHSSVKQDDVTWVCVGECDKREMFFSS